MNSQCCGTCAHAKPAPGQVGMRACRFNPPTTVMVPVPGPIRGMTGMQQITVWPVVKSDDPGCSRYRPSLETLQGS